MLQRLLSFLILAAILVPSIGCCHITLPRRGLTVRGGLDFREHKKPLGFVEVVDTEWDEMRRNDELRWLENSGYGEEGNVNCPIPDQAPSSVEFNASGPDLGKPSDVEETPPPIPPVPPEPELGPDTESPNPEPLPSSYNDEDDYREMIELTGYEQNGPVSLANRATQIGPADRHTQRQTGTRNWLWSKP